VNAAQTGNLLQVVDGRKIRPKAVVVEQGDKK
jgi:hypothetical protein